MTATPFALMLFIPAVVLLFGVPAVVMVAASRGGSNLARIVNVVAGVVVVIAVFTAAATLIGLGGAAATVTVPISTVPVRVPDGITFNGPMATIQDGGFDRMTVTATGLTLGTRIVLAAGVLLGAATAVAIALVVVRLVRSIGQGDPFALGARGWMTLVGGTLATWVGNVGDWLASRELCGVKGWSGVGAGTDVLDLSLLGWPNPASMRLDLPWQPIVVALVLALLAAVFRHGERLRQDAEGLV